MNTSALTHTIKALEKAIDEANKLSPLEISPRDKNGLIATKLRLENKLRKAQG